jgi:DNA invertase Pin-like site-specific DNA recombinase
MANRKIALSDAGRIKETLDTAAGVATAKKQGRKPGEKRELAYITQRVDKERYERLQELFGSKGLAMATAANMALFYIADMVEAGALSISRGGIIDTRRR